MTRLRIICSIGFLVTVMLVTGQTPAITSNADIIQFMNSDHDYLQNRRERYARIDGSPYLDSSFREGYVVFQDKKFTGLQLRYNAYEGTFEYRTDDGIRSIDPDLAHIDTVCIARTTFLDVWYLDGQNRRRAYMRLQNRGHTQVLLMQSITLLEAKEAQGYEEARGARFKAEPDKLFIRIPGEAAKRFLGRKSLENIFVGRDEKLTAYAKDHKLKLRKPDDLVELCAYYDSLKGTSE